MTYRDDGPVGSEPIPLTREGRRILAAKVRHLREEIIPELLREHVGHDNQLERDYQHAVGEMAQLCERLARGCDTETLPDDPRVVELGEVATISLEDGTLHRFLVVHPFEAPIGGLRVSSEAPLGRALLGRRVGDEVEVPAPRGSYRCRIISTERLGNTGRVASSALVLAGPRPPTEIARPTGLGAGNQREERKTHA